MPSPMTQRGHPKKGGRKKGTPNKRSLEAGAMLEANGFDPDLPWIYWARVLTSAMAKRPMGQQADKAEQFYQGRELVSDGEAGNHYEPVYARATAEMADKAAKGLAPYIRPQLMRVQGTGANGEFVITFEEDPTKQGTPRKGSAGGHKTALRVEVEAKRRVREL